MFAEAVTNFVKLRPFWNVAEYSSSIWKKLQIEEDNQKPVDQLQPVYFSLIMLTCRFSRFKIKHF